MLLTLQLAGWRVGYGGFLADANMTFRTNGVALLPADWQTSAKLTRMGTTGKTYKVVHRNGSTLALRVDAPKELIDLTLRLSRAGLTPRVLNYSYLR
jgi:hypothetical protein